MAFDGIQTQTYLRRAMRGEMLDADTELALARAWRQHGDEAALARLVAAYMKLAVSMASRFRRYGASMEELVQEATVGLLKAAQKFDPARGNRFSTYAVWWVRAALQDYTMRNHSLVRTGATTAQKSLFFNLRRVEGEIWREAAEAGQRLGAEALRARVAARLGVTEADVETMQMRLAGSDLSLNMPIAGEAGAQEWVDTLEDDAPGAAESVPQALDLGRLRGWLGAALATLTAREQRIIAARRLREAPRTLEDLGGELGISKERVRQIEAVALAKLRRTLAARGVGVQDLWA
ncbi:MAG: RNA polymerase factor sigma-32 [Alphaproteobacteria bacterium HGW-Alphaproteobacteria-4]|jgi:RNA polymerase sigma-32 factor|nr:MAG: RNA polymerase factor sigma-32 [Alphaproteobacteria bacterium HGW-Alphaproteobacteria-4]